MAVTLKEIADACGVSRGTVDRALHNRGRVQPEVAERIRKMAEELGYEPNAGGRALAMMKKEIVLGVILQFSETMFIRTVEQGIEDAAAEIKAFGCRVRIEQISGSRPAQAAELIREMASSGVSGIALVATEDERVRAEVAACQEAGIPVVTFNSDLSESGRLCFVGEERKKGGQAAAGIVRDILPADGRVAVFSGRRESMVQSGRAEGFCEILGLNFSEQEGISEAAGSCPLRKSAGLYYTDDDPKMLLHQLREILARDPDLAGIYINTQGVHEACDLLKQRGLAHQIRVIVHDLALCRREDILDGTIDYVIDADAHEQGYRPLMLLFDLVYHGRAPEQELYHTRISIHTKYTV